MLLLVSNNNTVLSFSNVKDFKLIKSKWFEKTAILSVEFKDNTPIFACHLNGDYKIDCEAV